MAMMMGMMMAAVAMGGEAGLVAMMVVGLVAFAHPTMKGLQTMRGVRTRRTSPHNSTHHRNRNPHTQWALANKPHRKMPIVDL